MLIAPLGFLTSIYNIGFKEVVMATLIFAIIYIFGSLRTAKYERKFYKNNRDKYFKKWERERDIRLAFQKGLGLPVSSLKECYESLWTRAGNGDEDAEYIVLELIKLDIDHDNFLDKTKFYQKKSVEKKELQDDNSDKES